MAFRSLKVATLSDGGRKPRAVSDGTTLLFGLPGVRVERVERCDDGARVVQVVTDEEAAAACPGCGVVSFHRKSQANVLARPVNPSNVASTPAGLNH